MVSSDVGITGAVGVVARQTGLRAVQIKTRRYGAYILASWMWNLLRNGPDKNDSNNGNEQFRMPKFANFSIVCTYFLLA